MCVCVFIDTFSKYISLQKYIKQHKLYMSVYKDFNQIKENIYSTQYQNCQVITSHNKSMNNASIFQLEDVSLYVPPFDKVLSG